MNFTPITYFFLFYVVSSSLFAQKPLPNNLQICISFVPTTNKSIICHFLVNKVNYQFTARDTCLSIPVESKFIEVLVVAEGFNTQKIQLKSDTLTKKNLRVVMKEKIIQLKEVKVNSGSSISYRGDTLIIKTDSIAIRPHANASELFSKIPGVTIDRQGQITVMGKSVSKVMVDGETIFGGNSKATLETIKGDMVKQLEVVDKGRVELNIRLREDKNNGAYGEITGNLGTQRTQLMNVRLNTISPKRFINFFLNSNNQNERSLSPQNESQILSNTFSNGINGAYSIVSTIVGGVQTSTNRFNQAPSISDNDGISRSSSMGLNYNNRVSKNKWLGYLLVDYENRSAINEKETIRLLNQNQQIENAQITTVLQRFRVWGNMSGTIKINDKNVLRVSNVLIFRDENEEKKTNQTVKITDQNTTLNEGSFDSYLGQKQRVFRTAQQLQWEHRYQRPAKVTSFYAGHFYETQGINQNFYNLLQKSNAFFKNNNEVNNFAQQQFLTLQSVHNLPLNRRLLWETRIDFQWDFFQKNQAGYRFTDSTATRIPSVALSINDFTVSNHLSQLQTNFLYKLPKLSVVIGLTGWRWATYRAEAKEVLLSYTDTKLSPLAFFSYQFNRNTKLSLKYSQNTLLLPNANQLFPVVDSSVIQRIQIGNSQLLNSLQQQYEMRFQTTIAQSNAFNLSVQWGEIQNPVVPLTRFNFLGFPTQSFIQFGRIKQFNIFAFWGNFSRKSKWNYHLVGLWNSQEFLNIVADKPNIIRTNNYFLVGNSKFSGIKNVIAQLDFQWTFFKQRATDLTHQGVVTLKIEAKLMERFYIESNTQTTVFKNFSSELSVYPLSDLQFYGYAFKNNKVRFSTGIHNIFDVRNLYRVSVADNFRQIQSVNRLPRFFTIGLTFYVERWKKLSESSK